MVASGTGWAGVDWRTHVRDVLVRGRTVRCVDIGASPKCDTAPLLLVHGLGGSWQTWLENLPALAATRRVVAVDLPGFGRSDPLPPPAELSEHVECLVGLMDVLGLDRAHVVGHSMGGLISLLLAGAHPDRVAGLVLVDAGGVELGRLRLAMIVGGFEAFNALFSLRGVPAAFARRPALRRTLLSPAVDDWRTLTPELALEIIPPMRAPGFGTAVRAAARASGTISPDRVGCPVLLIWGRNDRILPVAAARRLAAQLPDARLVVLERTGHCPMFESPAEFNRVLLEHLAGTPVGELPADAEPIRPGRAGSHRDRVALRRRRRAERRVRGRQPDRRTPGGAS